MALGDRLHRPARGLDTEVYVGRLIQAVCPRRFLRVAGSEKTREHKCCRVCCGECRQSAV